MVPVPHWPSTLILFDDVAGLDAVDVLDELLDELLAALDPDELLVMADLKLFHLELFVPVILAGQLFPFTSQCLMIVLAFGHCP